MEIVAKSFGCIVDGGGKHPLHVVYKPLGVVIPVPTHGKHVKEAYIKELKDLFNRIQEEKK